MTLGTVKIWTIRDLIYELKSDKLELQPSFQRKLVWNNNHKERFLNTILKGLPFPEIYIAKENTNPSTTLVVDGQQRIHTIYQYFSNDSKLRLRTMPKLQELPPTELEQFLGYEFVVRDLGTISNDLIIDIFNRINSVSYALTAMELQNSLYTGEFISVAHEILKENPFEHFETFSKSQAARMQDLEFILLIMSTVELEGYFPSNKELEAFIQRYDDDYPQKEIMKNAILETIRYLHLLEIPMDSIWLRKSSLFTLIVELTWYYLENSNFPDPEQFTNRLTMADIEIIKNKNKDIKENIFARFYNFVFQATASRQGRISRGELVELLIRDKLHFS
ncbi:DUF262 domain-containing protein [Bacillus cereus]|uniref:DUF262 domain-containing protein n=1 Tax=Bacillus cereus TaxID=1396 RepID=UPI0005E29180|nr:DUF262 domain-containing protein [Bacillus cereus]MDF9488798.1 DUF262 domain-containing protein [Bacillus cereus]COF21702.1 Uncharacterized conserved protein [Streptococcus pneumoniae]